MSRSGALDRNERVQATHVRQHGEPSVSVCLRRADTVELGLRDQR